VPDDHTLLTFATRGEWRSWLESHHDSETEARVVIYKSGPLRGQFTLQQAQEEALCFGWVDASNGRLDDLRYWLRFVPRRAGSAWSLSNIRRVERLTQAGLMTQAGLDEVAEARRNGQWELGLRVEQTDLLPPELEQELLRTHGAMAAFTALSHSRKKQILRSLLSAKSPATMKRRVDAVVEEVVAAASSGAEVASTPEYAGRRDPRFVAVHRGGLLDPATHRLLASWAADCAEHVLPLFAVECPGDLRPHEAIETARAWSRGEATVTQAREAAFAAHAAARGATDAAAREVARAAGHAAATAHMADHELGAAAYAIKAVRLASPAAEADAAGERECGWQREHLPEAIRALVLSDEEQRNEKLWSLFTR
jgi:uncharacterized protein YdeI (YjbR/CyaY-like superfamily)